MYFVMPRAGLGSTELPTIGELRAKLKPRLQKLSGYDLFLRDRSVAEWFKDNSLFVNWMRTPQSRQVHKESHEFWTHVPDSQRRPLIQRWLELIDEGTRLSGDARQGGIGQGYGPSETAPPARARPILDWIQKADRFIADFELLRRQVAVEARAEDSNPVSRVLNNALRPLLWTLGLGVAGVVAFNILSRPRR